MCPGKHSGVQAQMEDWQAMVAQASNPSKAGGSAMQSQPGLRRKPRLKNHNAGTGRYYVIDKRRSQLNMPWPIVTRNKCYSIKRQDA